VEGPVLSEKVDRWIAEYKAEGRVEGIAEGRVELAREMFHRMKKAGMSIADMSNLTGFSEDEIKHMM
jgi:pentatricopeptide repeat protein